MRTIDVFALAAGALVKHRLRSGLSLVGVSIGVASVVLLTALGEGARRYVGGQFQSLGTNLLIVIPGKTDTTGGIPGLGGAPNDLTLQDAEALRRGIPRARLVVPITLGNDLVEHRERGRQVSVVGTTPGFLEARKLHVARGSFLPEVDPERGAPLAVLGSKIARELFVDENPIGGVVRIGGARMRVLGVLEPRGTQLGMDLDQVVVIPVATAMRLFDESSLFRVLIQVSAFQESESVRKSAIGILSERHGEEDVTVVTQDSVVGALSSILQRLTWALAGIAAISLAVAGIGIMNVMLVSVSERTAEVGLLRAVGARRRQVVALFLAEAVLLSSAGGLAGLALSLALTRGLRWYFPDFPAGAPPWAIAAAVGVSLAVGATFGVLPARKASRVDPVLALSRR